MIEATFFFIFGFLACLALCWLRIRELKRALDAALGQNAILWEQNHALRQIERRHEGFVSMVFAGARDLENILSGKVAPPSSAELNGRHSRFSALTLSGPSSDRRSHFSGRCE